MVDKHTDDQQEAEPEIGPTDATRDGAQEAEALQEHFARLTFDSVEQGKAGSRKALLALLGRAASTISYVLEDPARFEPLKAHPFYEISRKKPKDDNIPLSMMYFITRATTIQMRGRAGKYARNIEFMMQQGIHPNDMPERIRLLGGIEATYERAKHGLGLEAVDSDRNDDTSMTDGSPDEGGAETETLRVQRPLSLTSSVTIEDEDVGGPAKPISTLWPRSLSRKFLADHLILSMNQRELDALRPGRIVIYAEVEPPDDRGMFPVMSVRVNYLDSSAGPWPELAQPSAPEKHDDAAEAKDEPIASSSVKADLGRAERAIFAESFRRPKRAPSAAVATTRKSPLPPRKKRRFPSSKAHVRRPPSTKPSTRKR